MGNKTVKNVGIILGCAVVAKVLSYVWEATMASLFGISDQADALYMVTSIFGILYPILDLGIWKVFLPAYKKKLVEKEESKAEEIANISITFFLVLSVALVLFLIVLAKPIVALIAHGFDPEKRAMTIEYLRISAPTYFLMAAASVIGAMLQSRERFLGSQIREIGTHVSKLIYVFVTYKFFGIYAAVTAMIVGSIFRLLIQLPFINWKWKFRINFNFKNKDIVQMAKGLPSVALTAAIAHLNGIVDRTIASGAGSGSVASINYGHKLMNVFSGMISTAIATAVYPSMIQYITQKDEDRLREQINAVVCALMFFIVPVCIFCFLYSNELVTIAFQRGEFDSAATAITSSVFVGYCLGMLSIGIGTVITNVFYGFGDTRITLFISMGEIIINIILDLVFVRFWSVAGLAYATSIASIICLFVRFFLLRKYIKISYRPIITEFIKIAVISAVACAVPYLINYFVPIQSVYIRAMIGVAVCGGIYVLLSYVMHIRSMSFIAGLIKKTLKGKGKKEEAPDQ